MLLFFAPLLLSGFQNSVAQKTEQVRPALRNAATRIDLLEPLAIGNYPEGPGRPTPSPESAEGQLASSDYPAAALVDLLSDPVPRVRTLALELLFRKLTLHRMPESFVSSFPRLDRFGNPMNPSDIHELVAFLQQGAQFVSDQYRMR